MKDSREGAAIEGSLRMPRASASAPGKRTLIEQVMPTTASAATAPPPPMGGRRIKGGPAGPPQHPSYQVSELAQITIDELAGRQSRKVLLSTVLAAKKLGELPAFAGILKARPHGEHGDHLIFLASQLQNDYGSKSTVSILQLFADDGVDVTSQIDTHDLQPLAAVAKFRSLAVRFKALVESGDITKADLERVGLLIAAAEHALRSIEGAHQKPGSQVKLAGGAAMAASAAWRLAGALAVDDVTGIGVADDVAIPFVIIGAAALSALAIFTGGPQPVALDYGPAKTAVDTALRYIADLLAVSTVMSVQGARARGEIKNVARHLARILALAAVGGQPSGEPPKKNDRDDKHWWSEIKASLKNYLQATRGASSKQVMRELLKDFSEAQITEIEAALARAEQMMGEQIGKIIPPP